MDERRLAEILNRVRGTGGEVEGPNLDLMDTPGVTVADVLRVFDGARVVEENKPISCQHCSKQKSLPAWRKGGKIIRRTWADGYYDWGCHFCGRVAGSR